MTFLFRGLIILLLFISPVSAMESYQGLFSRANKHFEAGDYEQAAELYLSMERQGCINAKVFYNLGNCYLRMGDIGNAILYYRRADKLTPRDPDIHSNLKIARSIVERPLEFSESFYPLGIVGRIIANLTALEITVAFIISYYVTLMLAISIYLFNQRRTKKRFLKAAILSCVLTVLLLTGLVIKYYQMNEIEQAVAIGEEVIARNGPGDHFQDVFKQEPGYEVIIKRRQSGWVEINLPNGFTGWVPESSLKKI
ncbi:tetratricopeptide repeat protein [bacterium]|nr:tetratricopeptide repeat protein [candidate division CSSED10-310 bacterium]